MLTASNLWNFCFITSLTIREFQQDEMIKIFKELPINIATNVFKEIPVKIMIKSVHIYFRVHENFQLPCKKWKFSWYSKVCWYYTSFKEDDTTCKSNQCVKSVQIRSYFWSLFSPNRWEYGPEITPYLNTFHAVNYRLISILSNFSKLIEKWIYTQINSFIKPKTWKYLPSFCKNDNAQHALLKMTETWRAMLNTDNKVGAVVWTS